MRNFSLSAKQELQRDCFRVILVALELQPDSGNIYLCTGLSEISYGGVVYLPTGFMSAISSIEIDANATPSQVQLALAWNSGAWQSATVVETIGKVLAIRIGFIDNAGGWLVEPFIVFSGIAGNAVLSEEGILLDGLSPAVAGNSVAALRMTHYNQIRKYPGDIGLERSAALAGKDVVWKRRT